MVESVEILPPEFQGLAFRDDEILGQRKIKQVLRWSTERTFQRRAVTEGLLRGGVSTTPPGTTLSYSVIIQLRCAIYTSLIQPFRSTLILF